MTRLRIAIDARSAQRRPYGGVGRGIAATAARLNADFDLTLLVDCRAEAVDLGVREATLRSAGPSFVWLQTAVPLWLARHPTDVFHCPWYGLPRWLPTAGVATLHDLTFEHRPDWFTKRQVQAYRTIARRAAKTARLILAPSQHVLDDIALTYGVAADRLVKVPNAVDPIFSPTATTQRAMPADYLVAVGGAQRRRVDLAIGAWRQAATGAVLVVIGEPDLATGAGILSIPHPSDQEWAGILAGAVALVYPTEYEGFGLPALEAAASGTPTVATRVGAVPEVLADAAIWADSLTAGDLAIAIRNIDVDAGRRALARAAALPSWGDVATELARVYRRAAA